MKSDEKDVPITFKKWLWVMGYNVGLQDELRADEIAWGRVVKVDVFKIADEYMKDMLKMYTDFLLRHNYCDADVYCEPPTAIDRFLFPSLREK